MHAAISDHGSLLLQARETLLGRIVLDENIFLHLGTVDPAIVQRLLSKAEEHSIMSGDPVMLRKRLFSVMVEGLENIQRHASGALNSSAAVLLRPIPNGYSIHFGNGMPSIVATILDQRLALFNQMDDDDLKEHYLKLLESNGRTERGGAGLGLISMARKSSGPMLFESITVSEDSVYGMFQVNVMLAG